VVWSDRSWLGEGLADIHNFFNSVFNFMVLSRLAQKAFEFSESCSKLASSNSFASIG
jgi:hypothetical protein